MSQWVRISMAIGLVLAVTGLVHAQPLVERVPAGVESYIGWRGADALQAQYQGSRLQGVLGDSQLPEVFEKTWPKVIERVAREDARTADALRDAGQILRVSWRYPTAIFYSGAGEDLRGGVIVQAGAEAPALIEQFRKLADSPPAGLPMKVFQLEDMAVIAFGYEQEQMALAGTGEGRPQPITTDTRFTSAMAQVQKDAAIVIYGSFVASVQRANQMLAAEQGPTTAPVSDTQAVRTGTMKAMIHLMESLDSYVWSAGFDGKEWRTDTFIAAPAPRKGLATLLDAKPLNDELLQAIPRSADWVVVRRLDFGKLINEARATAAAIGPDAVKSFDQVLGGATVALGTNVQQNLFDPLGDEWAIYISPTDVGAGFTSAVILNRVDDPARINRGLSSIAIATTNVFTNAMRRQKLSMQLRTVDHKGTRISYLPTPMITPAWAIRGNLLYMGLYPQTVAGALDAASATDSILDNEQFQAARKRLPDHPMTSVSFVDLPVTTRQSYPALLMIFQSYMGIADLFDAEGQPLLLPTLSDLQPHLTPAARVAWVDDAGWHAQTIGPFPLSDMLGGEFSAIAGQTPLIMGGMIPALLAAREEARDTQTLANLRQIGQAIMMYSMEHKGALPQDLSDLVKSNYLASGDVFRTHRQPKLPAPQDPNALTAWVRENSAFIYIRPADKISQIRNSAQVVIVYEDPTDVPPGEDLGVLFADGHAESMTIDRLNQLLAQQGAKVE
jgi:hypothetical protein